MSNHLSSLISAARAGNIAEVERLVADGVSLDARDESGLSALAVAAISGHTSIVNYLLEKGAGFSLTHQISLLKSLFPADRLIIDVLYDVGANLERVVCENGLTVLLWAVQNGYLTLVKLFLLAGANIEAQTEDEFRSIHIAAREGQTEIVQALIDAGAEIDAERVQGMTALRYAAEHGHVATAAVLLEAGASRFIRDYYRITPLMAAARKGRSQVLKLFLSKGSQDLELTNGQGKSALIMAVGSDDEESVRVLLDAGADVLKPLRSGHDPLSMAVESGSVPITKMLVDAKAMLNIQFEESRYPPALIQATLSGQTEIVEMLVKAGANTEIDSGDNLTALYYAVRNRENETLPVLVEAGADVHVTDEDGDSPILLAVHRGDVEAAECLIKGGARVNTKDRNGRGLLTLAVRGAFPDIVKLLVASKAQLDVADRSGEPPLIYAAINDQVDILKFLLDSKADPNVTGTGHRTALHHAKTAEVTELLLAGKADLTMRSLDGNTPLFNAVAMRHADVFIALMKAGADVNASNYALTTPLESAMADDEKPINMFIANTLRSVNARAYLCHGFDDNHTLLRALKEGPVDLAATEQMIKEGATLDVFDKERKTALMLVVEQGRNDLLKLLISSKANVDMRDHQGETALLKAVKTANVEAARILVENGALLDSRHPPDALAFTAACVAGAADIVELLISAKASVDSTPFRNNIPLLQASQQPNVLRMLLNAHAHVDVRGAHGETALLAAARAGAAASVEILLQAKASVNIMDFDDVTPVRAAVDADNLDIVKSLIAAGAEVDLGYSRMESPLNCLGNGSLDMMRNLIDAKANVNVVNKYGTTVLVDAIGAGNHDAVKILLASGAQMNNEKASVNALSFAVYRSDEEMLKILLDAKADPNARHQLHPDETPLMNAVSMNGSSLEKVRMLVEAGARLDHCDSRGRTPLAIAAKKKMEEVLRYLLEAHVLQTGHAYQDESKLDDDSDSDNDKAIEH